MKCMKATELTAASFAPYGRMAEPFGEEAAKEGENWICYFPVEFIMPEAPMGIGIVYSEEVPKQITGMERHVSREEILWPATQELIMFVDLPVYLGAEDARPNAETTKAFRIKPGQVVIINRGTWHSPAFAVSGRAKYFFLVEKKKDMIDQDENPWISFQDDEAVAAERE